MVHVLKLAAAGIDVALFSFLNHCTLHCLNVQKLNSLQDSCKPNQRNKNCNVFLKLKEGSWNIQILIIKK
jgi:hypothetical protein